MRRLVIIFALLVAVPGCSFVFVSGPPANHEKLAYFDCTSSNVVPVLDTIWTALQALNLITAVSRSDQEWNDAFGGKAPLSRGVAVPLYAVMAAAGAGGMYFGYTRVSACKDAKQELAMRSVPGVAPMPGTWPPPAPATAPAQTAPAPTTPTAPVAPAPAPTTPTTPGAPAPAPQ